MMTEKRKPTSSIKINRHDENNGEDLLQAESEKEESGTTEAEEISDPAKEMDDEIEQARQEAKENYDRFLRVSAEFENYKKRSSREMEDFRKYANEALIRELLTVVDNLERAIESCDGVDSAKNGIVEGVLMTHKEVLKILEKFHVQSIDALGKPFDPAFHQAVMQETSEDNIEQVVLKELQKGYMLHTRLLRPTMVVVSKPDETGIERKEGKEDHLQEQDDSETNQDR
jgi:molecular chaperone GrpE